MSVADDPESLRAKKSQNQLSSLKYHGKDRTNPASTPLSRPAFSAPGKSSSIDFTSLAFHISFISYLVVERYVK